MPDKLMIGIAGFLTAILGVFARISFVRKSQLFAKDGKPLFQYADTCASLQRECASRTCKKIDELKMEVKEGFKKLDETHDSVIAINKWIELYAERRTK